MDYKVEKKEAPGRKKVEVLGVTYEEGKPEKKNLGSWRQKLGNRQDKLKYLESSGKYWAPEE